MMLNARTAQEHREPRWGAAALGALLAEIAQIAAAFLWVAVYSYLLNPGQEIGVYRQYAMASGPYVSIFAGFPIFYGFSRFLAKTPPTALALFAIFFVVDFALLLLASPENGSVPILLVVASYASKLVACWLGGVHGTPGRAAIAR